MSDTNEIETKLKEQLEQAALEYSKIERTPVSDEVYEIAVSYSDLDKTV